MRSPTRRHILRGAGVALALPWLESLAPRRARGEAATPANARFVPIYFPLGTADYWRPTGAGAGDAWKLSPILEPLAALKDRVTVLRHVDQTAYGRGLTSVNPGNGLLTGSYLTAAKCVSTFTGTNPENGISVDQRAAQTLSSLALPSLQVGLASILSSCDGKPCVFSRSISWKDATTPLPTMVDPQMVFDKIVSAGQIDAGAAARRAAQKSVLDYVDRNASGIQRRLGRSDRERMEKFLASVRNLELRVGAVVPRPCKPFARPTLSVTVGIAPPNYDRNVHAEIMLDLIVLALQCDVTRVVSVMLDDARSDFKYTFLDGRHFTDAGSAPTGAKLTSNPVGYANSGDKDDGWATVSWWYVSKLTSLCARMAAVTEADGKTLLDNSVVWFGSGQQGESRPTDLPVLYVGGGAGRLKTGRLIDFGAATSQSLSNVYLTFLRHVFGADDASFGDSTGVISELVV